MMMEFLLSKLWLFLAGAAVLAVTVAAFGSLHDAFAEEGTRAAVDEVRSVLAELDGCPPGTLVRLAPDLPSGSALRVGNGTVWLVREGADIGLAGPAVVALRDGSAVAYIEARPGDVMVAERRTAGDSVVTFVQLEKAAASSSTALTNLWASASLL